MCPYECSGKIICIGCIGEKNDLAPFNNKKKVTKVTTSKKSNKK
jgi:hypothetical protein